MRINRLSEFIVTLALFVPFVSNARTVKLLDQTVALGFSPNAGAADVVVKAISEAKKSINIAALLITSDSIYSAIIDADNRGVDVKIVLDAKSANTTGSLAQQLIDQNIHVKLNNQFRIMHNKYIIIDGSSVQTGSFNYSSSAEKRNAENVIFLEQQPNIAKLYTANFEKLFAASNTVNNVNQLELNKMQDFSNNFEIETSSNENYKQPFGNDLIYRKDLDLNVRTFQLRKGNVDVAFSNACNYISSSPSAKNLILQVIQNAQNNIYMAAYNFSDPDIINALKDSQSRGVNLNIVLDYKANAKNSVVDDLKSLGSNIYLNKKFSIMHNKFIISDNSIVETGSFNYTTSADQDQCNNILVFYDQDLMVSNYMDDWNMLYQTSIKN